MNTKTVLLILSLLFVSVASATSVTINFTDLPSQTAGGKYVGYSGATINTGTTILTSFDLICDDYGHTTNIPSGPYTYSVTSLADLSSARFTTNQLSNYRTAAILLYNFDGLGSGQSALAGDYNYALWDLFTPSAPTYGTSTSLLTAAKAVVTSGVVNTDIANAYKELRIFTPTQANISQQEFLGLDTGHNFIPPTGVPEPASELLMGSGLILGALFLGRRQRNQQ